MGSSTLCICTKSRLFPPYTYSGKVSRDKQTDEQAQKQSRKGSVPSSVARNPRKVKNQRTLSEATPNYDMRHIFRLFSTGRTPLAHLASHKFRRTSHRSEPRPQTCNRVSRLYA
ncbi:hypothetical protein EVAR_96424_1 [Eumeta japonica]|uniref:Uncharacterized protein n=1 Tax=Eumeta variegata TaxID=151549 RepID=A0A4C1WE35_EUMVA|nr:hypothetical protein EVAR_96424_1 [Eumeta japonica]